MFSIFAEISSLIQYKKLIEIDQERIRPEHCACCGRKTPWRHGHYSRQSDRLNKSGESLNPIMILRYYCPGCRKTNSVLPECIPPRRWYPWEIQQAALLLFILGQSAYAIAKESKPSYKTISRWFARLQERFLLHKDTLCVHFGALSLTSGFFDFWEICLKNTTLGAAMRLCHVAEVAIP